jgi:hypothetical protein
MISRDLSRSSASSRTQMSASDVTDDFLLYTVRTVRSSSSPGQPAYTVQHHNNSHGPPAQPTVIAKIASSSIHADRKSVFSAIASSLPSLLSRSWWVHKATASHSSSATTKFIFFVHHVEVAKTQTNMPVREPFLYHVQLTLGDDQHIITFTTPTATSDLPVSREYLDKLQEATADSDTPPTLVVISGTISLVPEFFGATDTTRCTLTAKMDLKTPQDTGRVSILLDHFVGAVPALHHKFARYRDIDNAIYTQFEQAISSAPELLFHEKALLARSKLYDDSSTNDAWRRISGTVQQSVSYFQKIEGDSGAWGMAKAIVDAPAVRLVSYLLCMDAPGRFKQHIDNFGVDLTRLIIPVNGTHSLIYANNLRVGIGIDERIFASWFVWCRETDGSYVVAWAPVEECDCQDARFSSSQATINDTLAKAAAAKKVRGTTRGFWHIIPLAESICSVTYMNQGQFGGSIPRMVLNLRIVSTLAAVKSVQRMYMRNNKVVDSEVVAAMPLSPRRDQLSADQNELVERCFSFFETKESTLTWTSIGSTHPFLRMWIHHKPPVGTGDRSTALGKGTIEVDCPAKVALASYFNQCGRENMRINKEEGTPALFIVTSNAPHDDTFAMVKKMPFPLRKREFINRKVHFMEPSGDLIICYEPVDVTVDYGANMRLIRAEARTLIRFSPTSPKSCNVVLYSWLDAGGRVPKWVTESKMPIALSGLNYLRELFERDEEIDALERNTIAAKICSEPQQYTSEDIANIKLLRDQLYALNDADFKELESPDHRVKMSKASVDGVGAVAMRASVVLDARVEDCAVWDLVKTSRVQRKNAELSEKSERTLTAIDAHTNIYRVVYELGIPGFRPREWVTRQTWKWEGADKLVVVYTSILDDDIYPLSPAFVRAISKGYFMYERLEATPCGVPQTLLKTTQRVDLCGAMPKFVINNSVVGQLSYLSLTRKHFDKSLEVDTNSRARIVDVLTRHLDEAVYLTEETKTLDDADANFVLFDQMQVADEKTIKKLKTKSTLLRAKLAHHKGNHSASGWAVTEVRANVRDVMALIWDPLRRTAMRSNDLEKAVDEAPNDHSLLFYIKKRSPAGISDRDFLTRNLWRANGEGGFLVASVPEKSAERPEWKNRNVSLRRGSIKSDKAVVRGAYPSTMRILRTADDKTTIEYFIRPSAGGRIPTFFMTSQILSNLEYLTEIQEFFQEQRRMDDYDTIDGKALGLRLMYPGGANHKKPWLMVDQFVDKHHGMSELAKMYPWLKAFLREIVKGHLSMASSISTKLECLSEVEAKRIGASLGPALKARKTASAGLYQWQMQNEAMVELFQKQPWVEVMILSISQEIMKTAPWGLMWRVCLGAGLSIFDMGTDINVIMGYWSTPGQEWFGYALLAMVLTNLFFQLIMQWLQNGRKSKEFFMNALVIVVGLKPAADAYNVCSGKQIQVHQTFEPSTELSMTKCSELVAESIPGTILQMYVILLHGGAASIGAYASLVISALTTGYSSATLSYDYDTDPVKRKTEPDFYGYVPDEASSRTILLIVMTLNSSLLLVLRSFGAAMLIMAHTRVFAAYFVFDMVVYLLVKAAINDLHHWASDNIVVSILERICAKVISDYTGVVQLRGAGEIGGLLWTLSMVIALVVCLVSVPVHFEYTETSIISQEAAWRFVRTVGFAWVVSFGLFLWMMKREYWATFFSVRRGRDWVQDYFRSDDDAIKQKVVTNCRMMWQEIGEHVRVWVETNWWKWKDEKPPWFTEAWIARIPSDWIPSESQLDAAAIRAKMRRRSSIFGGATIAPASDDGGGGNTPLAN